MDIQVLFLFLPALSSYEQNIKIYDSSGFSGWKENI
jgi:hypothetical protein